MSEIFRQERSADALIEPADTRIARLHRYYLARELARGQDVLDLRAGDGSGAAILSQTARSVVALDLQGAGFPGIDIRINLAESDSFDLIVALDAIEHAPDPDAFLAGLRGMLRQGGKLLLATPDRGAAPGPPAGTQQHEFSQAALTETLSRHFPHVQVLAQRGLVGSAMFGSPGTQTLLVLEHRGELQVEQTHGLRPESLCILAANQPIDGLVDSLFIHGGLEMLAQAQARSLQARSELQALQAEHTALSEAAARKGRTDAAWRHELAVLRVNEAAANNRYTQARAQFEHNEQQYLHVLAGVQAAAAAQIDAANNAAQSLRHALADALTTADRLALKAEAAAQTAEHARQVEAARTAAFEAECARLRAALHTPPAGRAARLTRRLRGLLGSPVAPPEAADAARIAAIAGSPVFDSAWYQRHYYDIGISGADPATHYLRHGAAEDRNPNPEFDSAWYRSQHPDLAASGLTPAEHYARYGSEAGWPTNAAMQPAAEPEPQSEPEPSAETALPAEPAYSPEPEMLEPAQQPPAPAPPPNPKLLFISGEPDTPGSDYRCVRYAEAAREAGWDAGWSKLGETGATELVGVQIIVLWRARYCEHVAGVMREIRRQGGIVVFDVDDLMIRPELARPSIIDGMRTISVGVASTRETFAQIQQTMAASDLCITTTEELAGHIREWQKATYVLPNGFDDATHARSRLAVRRSTLQPPADTLVRIGYAAGTVTHQKDFAQALPGLLLVMRARPHVRLVLFRANDGTDLVIVDEFDELAQLAGQIEWRDKVSLDNLPAEIARFDINIAPLELGNPFCEAKSELKYFEAALVDVPTVASPTGPFARAIVHDRTGLLANGEAAWHEHLLRLVDDAASRKRIGRAAYIDCLWRFGPRRRAAIAGSFLEQINGTEAGARAFALETFQARDRRTPDIALPATETLFSIDRLGEAQVTVVIPCFNYADYIIEALESVRLQTLGMLDLVLVDDCSTDALATEQIMVWCRTHEARFNRILALRHVENSGLSAARNTGFAAAETPYIMPLDADNRLHPPCCETLLATLQQTRAAYAYPTLQMFGAGDSVFCNERYQPARFIGGNYIDAMAMIAKWAWAAAGGYDMPRAMGWEDFDLWCRLAELAQRGIHVPQVLAEYRVHGSSMVASVVEVDENKQKMVALIEQRHDWLRLSSRTPTDRV